MTIEDYIRERCGPEATPEIVAAATVEWVRMEAFSLEPEDRLALALALFESLDADIVEFDVAIPEPEPGEA